MNELVTQENEAGLAISTGIAELIQVSIADSTLKRYQRSLKPTYNFPTENLG